MRLQDNPFLPSDLAGLVRQLDALYRNIAQEVNRLGDQVKSGSGSPEGVLVAPVGTLYTDTAGGALTTLWVKESGVAEFGWVAK